MGKTKTAVVSGAPEEKLSGKDKYEKKRKEREAKKAKLDKKGKGAVSGVGLKGGERIKVVGADLSVETPGKQSDSAEAEVKKREPKIRGKKYNKVRTKVDRNKLYKVSDAIKLVKDTSFSKFDGTVELHISVKKQGLSVNTELPFKTGKAKRIVVADDSLLKKLEKGKIDFDVLLATAEMMPKLVPFAKLLGPKGLLPNPKNGTIIKTKADAKKFSANTVPLKTERKAPVIHTTVGKVSQKDKELEENVEAIIAAVTKRQIVKATLTSTMGPGIKLQI